MEEGRHDQRPKGRHLWGVSRTQREQYGGKQMSMRIPMPSKSGWQELETVNSRCLWGLEFRGLTGKRVIPFKHNRIFGIFFTLRIYYYALGCCVKV